VLGAKISKDIVGANILTIRTSKCHAFFQEDSLRRSCGFGPTEVPRKTCTVFPQGICAVSHPSLEDCYRKSAFDIPYSCRFARLATDKNRRAAVAAAKACEMPALRDFRNGDSERDDCQAIYGQLNCRKEYAVGHGLLHVSQRRLAMYLYSQSKMVRAAFALQRNRNEGFGKRR
jgi:hypothetical protein